jgi:hypothetical protein
MLPEVPPMRSSIAMILTAAALTGCEVQVNPPAAAPAGPGPSTTSGSGQTMQQGGGSALGKAKQSAGRIEDQVDLHNRRIEEAADDVLNP